LVAASSQGRDDYTVRPDRAGRLYSVGVHLPHLIFDVGRRRLKEASMIRKALLGLSLVGVLGLSACETYSPTPYQAAATKNARGYSETKIESDRYRISFKGNSLTNKETVETYMLFRAAELTLQSGFDTFTIAHRDTDKRSRTQVSGGYYSTFSYAYFSPRRGWFYDYDPFFASPRYYEQVTQYEASAEVVMSKGPKGSNPESFDAHDVSANLGPKITRPPQ
jgi:hypothetical protein